LRPVDVRTGEHATERMVRIGVAKMLAFVAGAEELS
jgi:hypothetical protein